MLGGGKPSLDGGAHRLEGEKLQEDEVSAERPPDHAAAFVGAVDVGSDHQAHSEKQREETLRVGFLSEFIKKKWW